MPLSSTAVALEMKIRLRIIPKGAFSSVSECCTFQSQIFILNWENFAFCIEPFYPALRKAISEAFGAFRASAQGDCLPFAGAAGVHRGMLLVWGTF